MGKITFQNLPNTTTPINATNLNTIQDISTTGSNENGYYVKYDDGTLIQWGLIDKTKFLQPDSSIYTTVQGINWYRSDVATVSLPINFIDTNYSPSITISNGSDGTRMSTIRLGVQNNSNYGVQLIGVEPFTSSGKGYTNLSGARWIAIGKWK